MKMILLFLIAFSVNAVAGLGELNVLVFEDGLPIDNYSFVLDGKSKVTTNSDGSFMKSLEEGDHFIEIKKGDTVKSISFVISEGENTEILLNVFSNDTSRVKTDLSEPDISSKMPKGKISKLSGRVTGDSGEAIAGAKIFVQGMSDSFSSDKNGYYEILVPASNYIISAVHSAYRSNTLRGVKVREATNNVTNITLEKASLELDDFIVVAPHIQGSLSALVEVRKNSRQVADGMGSEQISKSGDSDAAASLKRVTGLSIVDGKYVYIRGLGERYSNVLLNDTSLPSPDPTRRVVQLDLFPSGILQSLMVQKSYSPDLPGSFGGGTVLIKTKNIPEQFFAKVSIGTTYESGNSRVTKYKGGSKDYLGFDDGTRAMPLSIRNATASGNRLFQNNGVGRGGFSRSEMLAFSKDMSRNYNVSEEAVSLPPSLSISFGDLYKYKGKKFGYALSMLYSNTWDNEQRVRNTYRSDRTLDNSSVLDESQNTIKLSSMLNLGANLGKYFDLSSSTMVLRNTTDIITDNIQSSDSDTDANFRRFGLEWQERQLISQVLKGKHQLGNNKERVLNWRASYSEATRSQPDSRSYEQDFFEGRYVTSTDGKRNQKLYNDLRDVNQDVAMDVTLPISNFKNFKTRVKLGGAYTTKKRVSDTRRFKYGNVDPDIVRNVTGDDSVFERSIEDICTDGVIEAEGCFLEDVTDPSDQYSAAQTITAYFADTEAFLFETLRLNVGARVERSNQSILTYTGIDRDIVDSGLLMNDILPVANIALIITDKLQLRFAYSETISRPDFKDLSPAAYFDDERNRLINGNINLKGTIIENFDSRLEWYFGKGENISLGVFKKNFLNPIEEVSGSFDNDGNLVFAESSFQLANVGNATASGFEIEGRKKLGFIADALSYWSVGGNYSYIESKMNIFSNLASQVTNSERALQGQSPYVANVNIDYDNEDKGLGLTALYNVFGRRIDAVGTKPFGDTFEEPFKRLDVVVSKTFGIDNKVKIKFNNIINPVALRTQDGLITETYRKGRTFSASYTRTF